MWTFIYGILTVVSLTTTVAFPLVPPANYEFIPKPLRTTIGMIAVIGVLFILSVGLGLLARGEQSPLPWRVLTNESSKHGLSSGFFAFLNSLTLTLWIYFIPGHLFADHVFQKTNRIFIYPYVINILLGIILSQEYNIFYRLILFLNSRNL